MVDWSSHPVDVLTDLCPEASPELLAELRKYCDQPVTLATPEQSKWFEDLRVRIVHFTYDVQDFPDAGEEEPE